MSLSTFLSALLFFDLSLIYLLNNFLLVFLKFQLLVTTSGSLVVTMFVAVLELFTDDLPQLATSKFKNKSS